jgi:tRNA threonylcarbamoyladenosine modification (KEOPS) complex Cgi121 subunit
MAFLDLQIETTKRLAAQRQIDAAVSHLLKSELECAITLANGAEGLLPETESRQIFAYLREHPLSKQVDFDKTIGWLKHRTQPDAATIFEFEAAVVVARVMSKFAAAYTEVPSEWYEFLSWGVVKGHWPTIPSMK